jgi:hypothetical protein
LLVGLVFEFAKEFFEILTGAKIPGGSGDNEAADVVIEFHASERIVHFFVQLGAHRIALFGPVQDRPTDTVTNLDLDAFVGTVVSHGAVLTPSSHAIERCLRRSR